MYVFCLSCPSANFALQRASFVPREWLAAKGLNQLQEKKESQKKKKKK